MSSSQSQCASLADSAGRRSDLSATSRCKLNAGAAPSHCARCRVRFSTFDSAQFIDWIGQLYKAAHSRGLSEPPATPGDGARGRSRAHRWRPQRWRDIGRKAAMFDGRRMCRSSQQLPLLMSAQSKWSRRKLPFGAQADHQQNELFRSQTMPVSKKSPGCN